MSRILSILLCVVAVSNAQYGPAPGAEETHQPSRISFPTHFDRESQFPTRSLHRRPNGAAPEFLNGEPLRNREKSEERHFAILEQEILDQIDGDSEQITATPTIPSIEIDVERTDDNIHGEVFEIKVELPERKDKFPGERDREGGITPSPYGEFLTTHQMPTTSSYTSSQIDTITARPTLPTRENDGSPDQKWRSPGRYSSYTDPMMSGLGGYGGYGLNFGSPYGMFGMGGMGSPYGMGSMGGMGSPYGGLGSMGGMGGMNTFPMGGAYGGMGGMGGLGGMNPYGSMGGMGIPPPGMGMGMGGMPGMGGMGGLGGMSPYGLRRK